MNSFVGKHPTVAWSCSGHMFRFCLADASQFSARLRGAGGLEAGEAGCHRIEAFCVKTSLRMRFCKAEGVVECLRSSEPIYIGSNIQNGTVALFIHCCSNVWKYLLVAQRSKSFSFSYISTVATRELKENNLKISFPNWFNLYLVLLPS